MKNFKYNNDLTKKSRKFKLYGSEAEKYKKKTKIVTKIDKALTIASTVSTIPLAGTAIYTMVNSSNPSDTTLMPFAIACGVSAACWSALYVEKMIYGGYIEYSTEKNEKEKKRK